MSPANKADLLVLYSNEALDHITPNGSNPEDFVADMESLIQNEVDARTNPALEEAWFKLIVARSQSVSVVSGYVHSSHTNPPVGSFDIGNSLLGVWY